MPSVIRGSDNMDTSTGRKETIDLSLIGNTSVDITIQDWVRKVTLSFFGMSGTATSTNFTIQVVNDAGVAITTGYEQRGYYASSTGIGMVSNADKLFSVGVAAAGGTANGIATFETFPQHNNTWRANGFGYRTTDGGINDSIGIIDLGAVKISAFRFACSTGTWDAGTAFAILED